MILVNGRFWLNWQDEKISGRVDKSNTYQGLSCDISFFIKEIWSSSLKKDQIITPQPVVSFWFIHFSTYFYHIYVCIDWLIDRQIYMTRLKLKDGYDLLDR